MVLYLPNLLKSFCGILLELRQTYDYPIISEDTLQNTKYLHVVNPLQTDDIAITK